MRPILLMLAMWCACAGAAFAAPPEVSRALPGAAQIGAARYQVLAVNLFEAALYAEGETFAWRRPFALSLTYGRAISGEALLQRTVTEMTARGAEPTDALRAALARCFTDVARGDRFTGVSTSETGATFYLNGVERCRVSAPGFRRAFFGIWLDGDRTFTTRLRGG